ncbi:nitrite/sulfite reductase [Roseateles chitinivorans]|uniref:nitrite/sulfite reductase n=1 Tax=Roseateles chitinivorans TaxID=2917965 RepID=UPI003D674ED3
MYAYTDFDRQFVHARAARYRDQLERHLAGQLPDDDFRALRLQNGWYIQRHAPMLRVAVPYGVLDSRQLRQLARIAREHDRGYGHFTTRQNLQFNWIPLTQSADVMDLLADVDMHGIQTSGNCIRNITSDVTAGVAADELIDPRPYAEVLRQWSTLHPEFAFLPRKFKIAISGAKEDRAAIAWHDIGLQLRRNEAGEIGFQVFVGGGMGRTPIIGQEISPFVPWQNIVLYLEAIVRTYNRFGRRDNMYKARIKILVKAEGQAYFDAVNAEYQSILNDDAGSHEQLIPEAELARVAASFVEPQGVTPVPGVDIFEGASPAYRRWLERNVHAHRVSGYRSVTLSLKRVGLPPGDITDAQMDAAAALSDAYSHGELRVSHDQNLLLPWVRESDLPALFEAAKEHGFATPNIGLLTDMIVCPGGDFCALANARSIPVASEITDRFQDLDELWDIGDIDLHISGCINSCGHHHSGHIGVLGVDKDGSEWYQITLGGSDGSTLSGTAVPGKVIGPSFAADEAADAVEAVIATYRREREAGECFLQTVRRIGLDAFKQATNEIRRTTAKQ